MATFNLNTEYQSIDWSSFFPFRPSENQGLFKASQFDFAAPTGNQDATINFVKKGDLVYTTAAGVKLVEVETANATLKDVSCLVGVVMGVWSDDGRTLYDDGRTFTADGGILQVFFGKDIEIYTNKVFIHSQNTTNPDTRINLVPATHGGSGAALEGLIHVASKDSVRSTFVLK